MPKRLLDGIYLTPTIRVEKKKGENLKVIDEKNNSEELNLEDINHRILIYEREVKEWFLNPASELILDSDPRLNNGFVVLMICMAYFEGVEQYRRGEESNRSSEQFFTESIKRIYPDEEYSEWDLKKLYKKSRCGLFHNGMVKEGVIISYEFSKSIEFPSNTEIKINPKKLLKDIRDDFESYINNLKNASDNFNILRINFDRMFTLLP